MIYKLSTIASKQLEEKLDKGFTSCFDETLKWYRTLLHLLKYLGEWNYENSIQQNDGTYLISLSEISTKIHFNIVMDSNDILYLTILSFDFPSDFQILENHSYSQLPSELVDFFSWMKRLDEVKGARPTFWCD